MTLMIEKEMEHSICGPVQKYVSTLTIWTHTHDAVIRLQAAEDKIPITKDEAILISNFLQAWTKQQP